jgi:ubiquinone/menaquinone biosynthesis C-methylase UbiE
MLRDSTVRNTVRMWLYFPVDVYEAVARRKSPLIPPRGMRFRDSSTYLSVGKRGVESLIRECGLQPGHNILDVGCGTGAMALPLMDYLTTGSYVGFDIVPSWITWCQRHITSRNPRFHFELIDVYSKQYNSSGTLNAETLRFPYGGDSFDCVVLMSIFTHMRPAEIRNYIREVSRVMKEGAKSFITAFLINEESAEAIKKGRSAFSFKHKFGDCLVIDEMFPEAAIAVPEDQLVSWLADVGLSVEKVTYGSWAGRSSPENLHDDLIVQKL